MRTAVITTVAVLALAGCSGISTNTDWDESFDFAALSTYAWMDQELQAGVSQIMLRRLTMAVDEHMAASGFRKVPASEADFLVAYHTGSQDREQYDTYGYGAGGWWDGYWGGGMTTTTVRTYTEGTLILDVVDRASNELVWRGSASATIDQMDSPDMRIERIRNAVDKLMKDFPPR